MGAKIIAAKAAFLAAIQHPGTATRTHSNAMTQQLVDDVCSCIAIAKEKYLNTNNCDGGLARQFKMFAVQASHEVDLSFMSILTAEHATSRYHRSALKKAYRRRSISLCRSAALRARLWVGTKVAESLISDIREAHLKHLRIAVESLTKVVFCENVCLTEGFAPFGSQEDHISTHYRAVSGGHNASIVNPFGLEAITEEEEEEE